MWLGKLALEAIDFQSTAFFKELVALIKQSWVDNKEIKDPKLLVKTQAAKELKELILKYTGMKIDFSLMGPYAALPPPLKLNHVLYEPQNRNHSAAIGYLQDLITEAKLKGKIEDAEAWIDISTGKVGGLFSKMPCELILPVSFYTGDKYMGKEFSPEEHAAIVLHELGHCSTYFELILHISSTNQILGFLANSRKQGDKKFKVAVTEASDILKLSAEEKEILQKSKSDDDANILLISACDRKVRSELSIGLFDTNSWEQLCDQYAVRQGAGLYLASGLEKLYGYRSSGRVRLIGAVLGHLFMTTLAFAGTPIQTAFILTIELLSYWADGTTQANNYNNQVDTEKRLYSDDENRFRRIMHAMVERLKDEGLPVDQTKELIDSIEKIDKMADKQHTVLPFKHYLGYLFSSLYRRNYNFEVLQKQLESMVSNPLFVSAAKLKALAQ